MVSVLGLALSLDCGESQPFSRYLQKSREVEGSQRMKGAVCLQANSLDGPGGTRPQAAASEEGLSPQISRDGDENLRTQDSIRSITSTGSGSLGVPIPSGNTLKMANLFNKSKKQQA